jgi:peptide/nickel transport system substrate-binding protein
MITTGPFKIDQASMTNSQVTLVKVPTSWAADKVNFDKVVLYNGETDQITPVVLAKDVDYATHGFPPATEQAFKAAGIRVGRPPVFNGRGIGFNFDKLGNVFGDKKVRQAIAHAVDREQNAKITYADSGKGVKAPTNIAEAWLPDWLSADDIAKLNPYSYDPKKAETMLIELGWKKGSDNVWVTKEGVRCEFEMLAPAEFADASASAQNAAEQLTKFASRPPSAPSPSPRSIPTSTRATSRWYSAVGGPPNTRSRSSPSTPTSSATTSDRPMRAARGWPSRSSRRPSRSATSTSSS